MSDFREVQAELADALAGGVVFLVGATRWGTAWVQQCLDTHPYVCARGEAHLSDILFPAVGEALGNYNKQCEKISNRLRAAGLPANAAGLEYADIDHLLRTAAGLMFRRWVAEAETPPAVIVEKTPEHVAALDILGRILPDARVIHIYRDGRDEALASWEFNIGMSRGEFPRTYPTFADYAEVFAGNWNRAIDGARRFRRYRPDGCLEVRAEDIVEDPEGVAERLFNFVGVGIDEDWLKACTGTAWDIAPLDLEPGSWQRSFDDAAKGHFNRQAGELLKLLGY
jgi:hypothetical protein